MRDVGNQLRVITFLKWGGKGGGGKVLDRIRGGRIEPSRRKKRVRKNTILSGSPRGIGGYPRRRRTGERARVLKCENRGDMEDHRGLKK